jgi:ABC-2 type transport system ATP-binding protein
VLQHISLQSLKFNGGSYIAYFDESITLNHVLIAIGNSDLTVKYIRDISTSSRRFFVN